MGIRYCSGCEEHLNVMPKNESWCLFPFKRGILALLHRTEQRFQNKD